MSPTAYPAGLRRLLTMTLFLILLPVSAGAQIEITPPREPDVPQQEAPLAADELPKHLTSDFKRDFVKTTNDVLQQQNQPLLSDPEVLELEKLIENWTAPVSASVFLYLCIFTFIVGHALSRKIYKWAIPMLLIALFAPILIWVAPISYTRRYIYQGTLSQQLPVVLLQLLPTFVWWVALGDIAHWYERIALNRGMG